MSSRGPFARPLPWHLRTFLPRLAQADCNRLLAARHSASRAALERALLSPVHGRLDAFLCRFSVFRHQQPLRREVQGTCSHGLLLCGALSARIAPCPQRSSSWTTTPPLS